MPRGVYQRKAKITANPVQPAKLTTSITTDEALRTFETHVSSYFRQSILVASSAAVCMIVGAHNANGIVTQDEMIAKIRESLSQRTDVASAQVYKYVAVARALVNYLLNQYKVGGPVIDVLNSKTAEAAVTKLADHLTGNSIRTLEDLTKLTGKYQRTPTKKIAAPVTKAKANGATPAQASAPVEGGPPSPPLAPQASEPETDKQHSMNITLQTMPSDFVILAAVQAGHLAKDLAVASVNLVMLSTELEQIKESIEARLKAVHRVQAIEHRLAA